jgi:antitoxin VapB
MDAGMAKRVNGKTSSKQSSSRRIVKEPSPDLAKSDPNIKRASLFMNGRSQAVRLPKEFRFEGTHVYAKKEGNRVILTSIDDRWERFLAAFGSAPDFPDREEPSAQNRPGLDAWADASD